MQPVEGRANNRRVMKEQFASFALDESKAAIRDKLLDGPLGHTASSFQ
jgi:hypothetical protein